MTIPYRYFALWSRTNGVRFSTVSILCANTSRPEKAIVLTASLSPLKSGTKHSTKIAEFLQLKIRDHNEYMKTTLLLSMCAYIQNKPFYFNVKQKLTPLSFIS